MEHDDVLSFANYLGLEGTDADLFYESYYNLDSDSFEYEMIVDECVEGDY